MWFPFKVFLANPFFSGGFALMISGALMALCRHVPQKMWTWFKRQFVVEVIITSDDPIFEWITLWLHEHPYSKKTRSLIASSLSREYECPDGSYDRDEVKVIFSPARGNHFFLYRGRMIWLHRGKDSDGGQGNKSASLNSLKSVEAYNIRVLGRAQGVIRKLIEDAQKTAKSFTSSKLNIYICGTYGWNRLHSTVPRSLATVFLPKGESEAILHDINRFLSRSEWYRAKGIPYHRGYLLYGLAGTGKTSVITAIAGELKLPLYVMSISGNRMDDEKLIDTFRQVPPKSIILLEDIDAAVTNREGAVDSEDKRSEDKKGGITLSGLLNCLDGVMAKDGCLVFMTTNHVTRLDSALIRPGRVDYRLEFKEADHYQIATMYDKFNFDADIVDIYGREPFIEKMLAEKATTAKVQEELMRKFD